MRLQAQAADDGKWYAAEVVTVAVKKKTVKIHWVGYTAASDEWVGADRLRSKVLRGTAATGQKLSDVLKIFTQMCLNNQPVNFRVEF